MKLEKIINLAIDEAKKSTYRFRIGCVIFDKKTVISKAFNSVHKARKKLHPMYQKWPGSVHAELDCIIKARRNLKGTSMLVVRLNRKDNLRLAMPCSHCFKYIDHVGISRVYYSTNEEMFLHFDL